MCQRCYDYPTPAPDANIPLIRETLEMIEREESDNLRFDMDGWAEPIHESAARPELCGTKMCFAGWGIIAAGGKTQFTNLGTPDGPIWMIDFIVDGKKVNPGKFAQEAFGLPNDDIFYGASITSVKELRLALEEMYGIEV